MTPPDSPYHYPKLASAYLEYDLDRANELLDGLGLSERDAEGYRLWNDGSGERVSWTTVGIGDAYDATNQTTGQEERKQLFLKIMDIFAEEAPCPSLYGDFRRLIPVKNGFRGIHDGYGWDCCPTGYENVIDNATWYWDEPEKHV